MSTMAPQETRSSNTRMPSQLGASDSRENFVGENLFQQLHFMPPASYLSEISVIYCTSI